MSIFQEKRRCMGPCNDMKPYGEMNGYQWCRACADAQEAQNRAKSGITSDFGPIAEKAVSDAIAQFPATFRLRAHEGTFRFSKRSSYVSRGVVYLYTEVLRSTQVQSGPSKGQYQDTWSDFVKGTVEEFKREVRQ